MATKKPIIEPDYIEELNFTLIGISSGYKDYRICNILNRALDIDLERIDDHVISLGRNNSNIYYARFRFTDEYGEEFTLLVNKAAEHQLIPELKNLDYLLLIKPPGLSDITEVRSKLLGAGGIQSVFIIELSKIKSRYNLLM